MGNYCSFGKTSCGPIALYLRVGGKLSLELWLSWKYPSKDFRGFKHLWNQRVLAGWIMICPKPEWSCDSWVPKEASIFGEKYPAPDVTSSFTQLFPPPPPAIMLPQWQPSGKGWRPSWVTFPHTFNSEVRSLHRKSLELIVFFWKLKLEFA